MSVFKSLRLAVAGSLVFAMPLQAGTAAVRASSAVPTTTGAVCPEGEIQRELKRDRQRGDLDATERCARPGEAADVTGPGVAWPAIGVILATIATAVVIESHDGQGRGTGFSR